MTGEHIAVIISGVSLLLWVIFLIDRKNITDDIKELKAQVRQHHEGDHVILARTLGRIEQKVSCSEGSRERE